MPPAMVANVCYPAFLTVDSLTLDFRVVSGAGLQVTMPYKANIATLGFVLPPSLQAAGDIDKGQCGRYLAAIESDHTVPPKELLLSIPLG